MAPEYNEAVEMMRAKLGAAQRSQMSALLEGIEAIMTQQQEQASKLTSLAAHLETRFMDLDAKFSKKIPREVERATKDCVHRVTTLEEEMEGCWSHVEMIIDSLKAGSKKRAQALQGNVVAKLFGSGHLSEEQRLERAVTMLQKRIRDFLVKRGRGSIVRFRGEAPAPEHPPMEDDDDSEYESYSSEESESDSDADTDDDDGPDVDDGLGGSDEARRHRYLQRKADRRNRRKEKGIKSAARRTKRVRRTRKITKFASKLGVSASPEDAAPREYNPRKQLIDEDEDADLLDAPGEHKRVTARPNKWRPSMLNSHGAMSEEERKMFEAAGKPIVVPVALSDDGEPLDIPKPQPYQSPRVDEHGVKLFFDGYGGWAKEEDVEEQRAAKHAERQHLLLKAEAERADREAHPEKYAAADAAAESAGRKKMGKTLMGRLKNAKIKVKMAVKLGVAGTNTHKKTGPLRKALSLGQDGKKSFMGLDDIVDDGKLAERVVKIEQELATRLKNLEKLANDTAGKQDALNEGLDTTVDDVKAQMNSLQGVVDPIAIRAAELTVSRHLEQHFGGGSSVLELRHDIDAVTRFADQLQVRCEKALVEANAERALARERRHGELEKRLRCVEALDAVRDSFGARKAKVKHGEPLTPGEASAQNFLHFLDEGCGGALRQLPSQGELQTALAFQAEPGDPEPDAPPLAPSTLLRLRVIAATLDHSVEMTTLDIPFLHGGAHHAQTIADGGARGAEETPPLLGPGGLPCETWAEALELALARVVALLDGHGSVTAACLDLARLRGEFDAFSARPEHRDVLVDGESSDSDGDPAHKHHGAKHHGHHEPPKKQKKQQKKLNAQLRRMASSLDAHADPPAAEVDRARARRESVATERDRTRVWEVASRFVAGSGVEELAPSSVAADAINEDRVALEKAMHELDQVRVLAHQGNREAQRLDSCLEEMVEQMRHGFASRSEIHQVDEALKGLAAMFRATKDESEHSKAALSEYEAEMQALSDQVRSSAARTPRYARLERLLGRKADQDDLAEFERRLDERVEAAARANPHDDGGLSGALNVKCLACNRPYYGDGDAPEEDLRLQAHLPAPEGYQVRMPPGAHHDPFGTAAPGVHAGAGGGAVAGGGGALVRGLGDGPPRNFRLGERADYEPFSDQITGTNVIAPKRAPYESPQRRAVELSRDMRIALEDSGTVVGGHAGGGHLKPLHKKRAARRPGAGGLAQSGSENFLTGPTYVPGAPMDRGAPFANRGAGGRNVSFSPSSK